MYAGGNKKVLLHECKRHTAHWVASAHYAALHNLGGYPISGLGEYPRYPLPIPEMGVPPYPDLRCCTPLLRPGMGYPLPRPGLAYPYPDLRWGYSPEMWTDKQTEISTFPHPLDVGRNNYHPHSMREGNIYTWECLFTLAREEGGTPIPGLDWRGPIPHLRGVPHPRSGWGGRYHQVSPTMTGWGTPVQTRDWVPPQPDLGWGTPHHWMRYPTSSLDGVLPSPHHQWMEYPPPQHSKHLLHSRQYASCIHAGGLSCYFNHFPINLQWTTIVIQ